MTSEHDPIEQVAVQVEQTVMMLREYARTERKVAGEMPTLESRIDGHAAANILDDLADALPELVRRARPSSEARA